MSGATDAAEAAPPLRWSTKLLYGVGSTAYGVKDVAFRLFILIYYNQVIGLPATLVSAAIFVALVVDAISDPVVGQFSDRLRTRLGRRHPLMYFSALPAASSFLFLWFPPTGLPDWQMFAYIVILASMVRTFITFYEIPSSALAPELTSDYQERTTIATLRYFFGYIGGLGMAFLTLYVFLAPTDGYPTGQLNPVGYHLFGMVGAGLMVTTVLISTFGTQHRVKYFRTPQPVEKTGFAQMLKDMLASVSHKGFLGIFGFGVLKYTGIGMTGALKLYFGTYLWLLSSGQMAILVLDGVLAALLGLVLAPVASRLFGKRNAALILIVAAVLIAVSPYVLRLMGLFFENGDPLLLPALFAIDTIYSLCSFISAILVHAMIGDVTDDSELSTGRRSEGLFYAANSFMQKCSSGFGLLVAGVMIDLVGLPENADPVSVEPSVVLDLALAYVPLLAALYIGAAFLLLRYKIDEKSHEANLQELERRRRSTAGAIGQSAG